ncbi:MAG: 30S ribosomal protein S9 [Phycisphaerae bacterium]|jgi:small subunit ribosomal protein S9|nr:30S ribosomal protein S9 [Phycisphaerae bacterium]
MPDTAAPATESRYVSRGPDAQGWFWGTGRRKTAVARVRMKAGTGSFKVNGKDLDVFFTEERDLKNINGILEKTNLKGSVNVEVNANGGGFTGQSGAVILGLGRAVLNYDPNLEPILREGGYLTRDDRKVERKKYGQAGARRRFQFSKR